MYNRLKIGVGPVPGNTSIDSFVLNNFSADELTNIEKMGKIAIDAVDSWTKEGIEKTRCKYNGKVI